MRRVGVWVYAAVLVLLALGLRLWGVRVESASFDEISASLTAIRPVHSYLSAKNLDRCPPLYYAILHAAALVNPRLVVLRIVSVLMGAFAAVTIYLIGRKFVSERAAALAGFLCAINPMHVAASQEAQATAMLTILSVAAFHYLLQSTARQRL